ncbi:MAG: putative flavoprotein (TIGR03862 family) [Lentimonas sp.]|jgi:uncharacterized flavoprotein (TIGR03862 family)
MKKLVIIGGGPAALMLAAQIDTNKYDVTLYDKKKTVGRKFLVAGEGGLNLTFDAPVDELISQYYPSDFIAPILNQFSNNDLINWLKSINVDTFIGSSNRVFPVAELKPIDVLKKIVDHIKAKGVKLQLDTTWFGWDDKNQLQLEKQDNLNSDITVFALGGSSWKVTGSEGDWAPLFNEKGIKTIPFKAANCAFEVEWSKNFITTHKGKPLKNITIKFKDDISKGEVVISSFGLEGNAIYALSQKIQEELISNDSTTIFVDLKPTMTVEQILSKYKVSKLEKITDILKEDLNLDRTSIALIKHFTDKETFSNPEKLAGIIKSVPVTIRSADDIDKAISTLGGIALDEIDENFQLKNLPNSYTIGEMLDWYAPTGGYLLQASFSMGFALASHLNKVKAN